MLNFGFTLTKPQQRDQKGINTLHSKSRVTFRLQIFLSLPVDGEISSSTSLLSHVAFAAFKPPVLLLLLCSQILLAEAGFWCFASMTLCVL